jgi:hypothetical protein
LKQAARGEFSLECGEIGSAFVDDHYFPVDDRLARHIEGAGIREKRFVQSKPLRV